MAMRPQAPPYFRLIPCALGGDVRGAVAAIGALAITALLGMATISVDLARGYSQMISNQRTADAAALSAALAYSAANANEAVLLPTAQDVAVANGMTNAIVTAALVTDVPSSGAKAVKVTVTTPVPFAVATALGYRGSYQVGAASFASLGSTSPIAPPCILALASSGTGIATSGGATIDAPDCSVAAVADIANRGTRIAAKNIVSGAGSVLNDWGTLTTTLLRYAGSFTNPSWNGNIPPADKRVNTATSLADPLEGNAELAAARQLIGSRTAPRTISNPSTPAGADWVIGGSPSITVAAYRRGSSSNFVIPAGTYTIGRLTIEGGMNVQFQSGSTITVANGVSIGGGSTVTFGDVNLAINGGFDSGSNGVTFGNGSLAIGSGTISFSGTNRFGNGPVTVNGALALGGGATLALGAGDHAFGAISIAGGSWLTMGAGDLDVRGGIAIDGGSTLAAGAGAYRIGAVGSAPAIALSGSAVMLMGDGAFSAAGDIVTAGGSRIVFGRTANHLIKGNLNVAGSALFGAGRYTVSGNLVNGTGGTTWPYSSPVTGQSYGSTLEGVDVSGFDLAGVNVSILLSGTINLAGGAKSKLIASSTTVSGGAIADLLLDSLTGEATSWSAGAQNVFVGAVHLPNSDLTMSGGSSTLSAGQCFMLIVRTITANGGAAAGSACTSIVGSGSSGGATAIGLVQ
ncbi:hypothetical protein [Sphingomonas elodea]|uniref:hypothetical protein n=1 Tax=Sphingomonas elodea TaxID=179878 RepID=UPI0002630D32|nr:hypothetical protein [Sphingomonas elodea]